MKLRDTTSPHISPMLIVKVFDLDCPVCEKMGKFDGKVLFDMDPPTAVKSISLERLADPDNDDPLECLIAQYVERFACNPDYTVDLPVYMVLEGKTYLGHTSGELSEGELSSKLKEIVSEKDPKGLSDTEAGR